MGNESDIFKSFLGIEGDQGEQPRPYDGFLGELPATDGGLLDDFDGTFQRPDTFKKLNK